MNTPATSLRHSPRRRGYGLLAVMMLAASGCADSVLGPDVDEQPTATVAAVLPPFLGCQTGSQSSGALFEICFPPHWNGDLVAWGHGYVNPTQPLAVPADAVQGTPVKDIVNLLGYAYAATSYRRNGLVATDAVADLEDLVGIVEDAAGGVGHAFLVGASEGGLSTALALERVQTRFDGGMALCGPVGSFRRQVNYFGDFRVIFDYFFPGVMPGTPVAIPPGEVDDLKWATFYIPRIVAAISGRPDLTQQLLRVTRAPIDANDPATVGETVVGLLRYSLFATNDANAVLGGNPYDNHRRFYRGSANDLLLNASVARFSADPAALSAMQQYETTGRLRRFEVTLHTTGDPTIPFWHELLYGLKVWRRGALSNLVSLPALRYGHCNFTVPEVLASFAILVVRTTSQELLASTDLLPTRALQQEFLGLAEKEGANPSVVDGLQVDWVPQR